MKTSHPLQSKQWAEFRKKTGIRVVSENGMIVTIHPVPHTSLNIGYFPKGPLPTKKMVSKLTKIGRDNNCIFIQLEPNVQKEDANKFNISISQYLNIRPAAHPLFTKYTFILDLTKSEEELLKNMHPKTRYNIKVAQKHGVLVVEDNSDKAFETYLKLTFETTKRQKFYAHDEKYHRLMWQTLRIQSAKSADKIQNSYDQLTAHLLLAKYRPPNSDIQPLILVAWILFVYKNTLYYPYGASSDTYRETMASNLMMFEAIRFGKKLNLKQFDMWGALGPNPDTSDPWYGFHRFKQGYGAQLIEFVGSYDLVLNPVLYELYKITDKLRWVLLRIKK